MNEFYAFIDSYVAEAKLGEDYHLASHGHRANGFRITIQALEIINQAVLAKMPDVINSDALDWWADGWLEHPLYKSIQDLRSMTTPFAAHVWKLLVTLAYRELQDEIT